MRSASLCILHLFDKLLHDSITNELGLSHITAGSDVAQTDIERGDLLRSGHPGEEINRGVDVFVVNYGEVFTAQSRGILRCPSE